MTLQIVDDQDALLGGWAILLLDRPPSVSVDRVAVWSMSRKLYLGEGGAWRSEPHYFPTQRIDAVRLRIGPDIVNYIDEGDRVRFENREGTFREEAIWSAIPRGPDTATAASGSVWSTAPPTAPPPPPRVELPSPPVPSPTPERSGEARLPPQAAPLSLAELATRRAAADVIERDVPIEPPPPPLAEPYSQKSAAAEPRTPPDEPAPAAKTRRLAPYATAAAVVVVCGAGLSYYVIVNQREDIQVGAALELAPGYGRACEPIYPLTFRDDFAPSDPRWRGPNPSKISSAAGQLVVRPAAGESVIWTNPSIQIDYQGGFICAKVQANDRAAPEDAAGIAFLAKDSGNYYAAVVYGDGSVGVHRKVDGTVTPLLPKHRFEAAKRAGGRNVLQVRFGQKQNTLWVNGAIVLPMFQLPADTQTGSNGLVAEAAKADPAKAGAAPSHPGEWTFSGIVAGSDRPVRTPQRRQKAGQVDVSVFSREVARAGEEVFVQVYMHGPKDDPNVARSAHASDPGAKRRRVETLQSDIAIGEQLEVRLEAPRLAVDTPVQTFRWLGKSGACDFLVTIPEDAAGRTYHLTVHVLRNAIPIGKIVFTIRGMDRGSVTEDDVTIPDGEVGRYRRAFVSYSSRDREEVLKGVQYLRAVGIEVVQDVLSFEPGRPWRQQIREQIDSCDLFLLFWSSHAASSEMVIREAEYAMKRQRESGGRRPQITPFILEGPPPPAPPQSLAELHFNDPIRYVIAAEAAARAGQ
jgi:hypothetical protein